MVAGQYRLVIRQGPNLGQVFELTKSEVFIGRDVGNDFVINDPEVSRKHARLTLVGDRYQIEDLNSTNGTYIDGQRLISPHVLSIGEAIMLGDNVSLVFDGETPAPDVTVPSVLDLGRTPVAAIPASPESFFPPPGEMSPPVSPTPEIEPIRPIGEPLPAEGKPEKNVNTWVLAGCSCLLLVLILVIALLVFIDQPWAPGTGGLYCKPPFEIFFRLINVCP